jgi:subtilase family serine protease
MRLVRPVFAAAGAVLLTGLLGGGAAAGPAASSAAVSAPLISIHPDVVHVRGALQVPPGTAYCEKHFKIACYTPPQVQRAYDLQRLFANGITGTGETIVIVDSYGSPTVRHDLAVFDSAFGLPAPPSLRIIQPAGKVSPYKPTGNRAGWAGEADLDAEYAHAIAPGASILMVETPNSENEGRTGFPAIVRAETYVISHHLGGVISQSFSATEQSFATPRQLLTLRSAYQDAARSGVTVLAASGDSGAADVEYNGSTYFLYPVTSWPDSDPLVTGVGGTQLHLNSAGTQVLPATVWNDTYDRTTMRYWTGSGAPNPFAGGGGKSVIFSRPWYQDSVASVVGASRGVPDISMSAACNGAVDMYQSFRGQPAGWYPTCGTSEATPEFAGIVALADQVAGHPIGLINPYLYELSALRAPGVADVVKGDNTVTFKQDGRWYTVHGFHAGSGYDLASGVGTVDAAYFVPELALAASHPQWTAIELARALGIPG